MHRLVMTKFTGFLMEGGYYVDLVCDLINDRTTLAKFNNYEDALNYIKDKSIEMKIPYKGLKKRNR